MERMKKGLIVIASSLLLFCFPAFADEPEASELPIEEVEHNVELVEDSEKEASDIDIDNLGEIQSGLIKAPSLDPNANYEVLGYYINKVSEGYLIGFYINGSPASVQFNRTNSSGVTGMAVNNGPNYEFVLNRDNSSLPYTLNYIVNGNGSHISVNRTLTYDGYVSFENVNVFNGGSSGNITTYLFNVSGIFTWLLSSIGILISFILGNAFLAVSLLLFMAGTVISFYIRIKNS